MSIQHIALVLEAADLTVQESAILIAMCNHTDTNGKTFAGEERLMREAKLRKTQFRTWRARLVERELIVSRRRGRQGGGRTTSDTYVNLAKLRSMRDPFFGGRTNDRPEDENPFSQVDSNGPENRTIDADSGGNGPENRTINGPENRTTVGRRTGPITLNNPQGEHTHQGTVEDVAETGVCVNDDEQTNPTGHVTGVVTTTQTATTTEAVLAAVPASVRPRITVADEYRITRLVADLLIAGHDHRAIVARVTGATNDQTIAPGGRLIAALTDMTQRPAQAPTAPTGPATGQCRACGTTHPATDLDSHRLCGDCVQWAEFYPAEGVAA